MARRLLIIDARHYLMYLQLWQEVEGHGDSVILDRRTREDRRRQSLPVALERRQAERRRRPEIDERIRTAGRAMVQLDDEHHRKGPPRTDGGRRAEN